MYEVGEPRTLDNLARHMILPASSLAIIYAAAYMRYVRSSILEAMNADYVRTAHAKGLAKRRIFTIHILKNAALPLVTIIGLDLPFVLSGAVITESIFAWPGMGLLFIESLTRSDYPVLMGNLDADRGDRGRAATLNGSGVLAARSESCLNRPAWPVETQEDFGP